MACCSTATVVTAAMPLAMAAGSCVGHALLRARRLVERGAGCVVWWRLTRASAPLVQPWWGFFYRELWIADGSPVQLGNHVMQAIALMSTRAKTIKSFTVSRRSARRRALSALSSLMARNVPSPTKEIQQLS